MVLFFLISWRLRKKSVKSLILQAHGRQPPILAVSLFLKILVRCPTVLQADVSLPLDVRSKVEVERDVDLVSAIYVYPADELVDDHLLRFKICTVVQVSILMVSEPCGSASTSKTFLPSAARPTPRFSQVVVLPVPPFWLTMAIVVAFLEIFITPVSQNRGWSDSDSKAAWWSVRCTEKRAGIVSCS